MNRLRLIDYPTVQQLARERDGRDHRRLFRLLLALQGRDRAKHEEGEGPEPTWLFRDTPRGPWRVRWRELRELHPEIFEPKDKEDLDRRMKVLEKNVAGLAKQVNGLGALVRRLGKVTISPAITDQNAPREGA